jgi:aminodeoxyfutalosine deaminase
MDEPARIELHTHVEGALTPSRLRELAARHGLPGLPAACLTADGLAFAFAGFRDFLRLYRDATNCLLTPADYHAVALDLAEMLARDGVVYAEAAVSYGVLLWRGIDPRPIQAALWEAAAEAGERLGVALRFVPDAVRQFGPDAAWRALDAALAGGRPRGVVGFGIGGDEAARPAAAFAAVCAESRAAGLGVTIHAGETGGPEAVRDAALACGAARVGHGIGAVLGPLRDGARAAPAPAEVDEACALLAERRVFVELCPGSNLATGAVTDAADHPLPVFLARGVPCGLNTDDRALFGLDLRGEYARAAAAHGLTAAEAAGMQRAALAAAFAEEPLRRRLADLLA